MVLNCGVGEDSWESSWTARRPTQLIFKEISPEYSLEGPMLKLQYFGHLMRRAESLEKDLDAGKDWGQQEKGVTEDEMVRWHLQLNGYEFEQTSRDNEGWGSLVCCSPWGHKELDTTEQLNNSSNNNQKNATASTPWAQNTQKISIMNHNTRGIHNSYIVCLEAVSTRPLPALSTWYNRFFMLLKLISSKLISFYILFQ